MNQPAPRELCEKLIKLGCKPDPQFFWFKDGLGEWVCGNAPLGFIRFKDGKIIEDENVPAFFQNDFTGATNQADQNLMIVYSEDARIMGWSISNLDGTPYCDERCSFPLWLHHKLEIVRIHQPNRGNDTVLIWHQYLERTMRK